MDNDNIQEPIDTASPEVKQIIEQVLQMEKDLKIAKHDNELMKNKLEQTKEIQISPKQSS